MAHAFAHYDPEEYSVIFNGIPIEGFAKDNYLDIEFDAEGYQDQIGADGHVVRYKSSDQLATVTFVLMPSSPSNKLLSVMYNADIKSPNGIRVGPLLIRNTQGATVLMGSQAWIQKMPKFTLGKEIGVREWIVRVAKLEAFIA